MVDAAANATVTTATSAQPLCDISIDEAVAWRGMASAFATLMCHLIQLKDIESEKQERGGGGNRVARTIQY